MPRKVCIITSNRADWGLLYPVAALLKADPDFSLQILATGQHLDRASGHSVEDITKADFEASAKVDMDLKGDSPEAVTSGLGRCMDGIGRALANLQPDLVIVLGDRYEILGAAMAASLARIPIAHLCGGDVTEGAMDDAFRHAVTKLAHLHFVSNADAARRVKQMGEAADRVFNVGSTGIDSILQTPAMPRDEFFASVGLTPRAKNILCTYHPETLNPNTVQDCRTLLRALDTLGPDVSILFTGANNDVHGRTIQTELAAFVASHSNSVLVLSLGSRRYFSALKHMDAVVGNSSSGLYEAPSFKVPTVNIGDRQKGRLRATSVIDTPADDTAISEAIARAFRMDCAHAVNPYGDGHSAARIVRALKSITDFQTLVSKTFADNRQP